MFIQLYNHLLNLSYKDRMIHNHAIEEKYKIYTLFGKKYAISKKVKNFRVQNIKEYLKMCYLYGNEIIPT